MQLLETMAHWAWETSLAATVLIVPALLAQLLLRKTVFTPIRHLLGLLVVARLLLPFALPSPLSIFNLIPDKQQTITQPTVIPSIPVSPIPLPPITNNKFAISNLQLLPLLWSLGAALLLARVLRQHAKLRRLLKRSTPLTTGPAAEALAALKPNRRVRLYALPEISTPALFGILRPSILLPANLIQSASPQTLKLILRHELAHVARHDVVINWLMIFAQALHWFNPLVWLSMRRLRAEQELLCDADVMRQLQPDERQSYGETLLALATPNSPALSTAIPISNSFKQMKERIAMITQFKPAAHRLLIFALAPLAAVIATLTFTGAVKKPALIVPAKAAENNPQRRIEKLEEQKAEIDARIRATENEIKDQRRQLRIPDAETASEAFQENRESIRRMEDARIQAQESFVQLQALNQELKKLSRPQLRHAMSIAQKDEALEHLLIENSKTEQQLTVLIKDYSEEHPEVVRCQRLLKNINAQIEERIDGLLIGNNSLLQAREAVCRNLEKRAEEIRARDAQMRESSTGYFNAKRELENLKKMRDTIYLRILEETVEMNTSKAK